MRISARAASAVVPLAVVAAVLAGCGEDNGGEGPGNGAGRATSTGPRSSAAAPVPTETNQLPTPDTSQTTTLLSALDAVDPTLTLDSDEAVQNAVALCGELLDGADAATAVPDTFPNSGLDVDQQQAVADAVTDGFCPLDPSGSASPS